MEKTHLALLVCIAFFLSPQWSRAQEAWPQVKLDTQETSFGKRLRIVSEHNNKLIFSPDGKRLAYWAWTMPPPDPDGPYRKDYVRVVVNGVPGKPYDYTDADTPHDSSHPPGTPIFSPDSQHLAYRALRGTQWMVVRDGKEGRFYTEKREDLYENNGADVIDDILFSPDSRHLAYRARRGGKWRVVLDEKEGKPYDWIADNDLHFSADSKRMAYHARRGKKDILVLHDGSRAQEMAFKPAPPKPAAVPERLANVTKTDRASIVKKGEQQAVVWNGRESKSYAAIEFVTTGPDDRHLAFWAWRDGRWFIVVDGVETNGYLDGPGADDYVDPSDYGDTTYGITIENRLEPLVFLDAKTLQTLALRADNEIVRVRVNIAEE
jgi:hypothetical protein